MQLSTRRDRSWRRRLLTSAVIVVAALALALWFSKRERQKYAEIRACIECLCESFVASDGGDATPCPGCDGVDSSLREIRGLVLSIPDSQISLIDIQVAPKGLAPFDRGAGSHEAIVLVGGKPRLGLFIDATTEQIYISGYWQPQEP